MTDIDTCMTPRLLCVASFAEIGCTVADIGTDHAYIPVWLVKKGIAKSAIAMDVNEGPILRAKENIRKFSLEDCIQSRLSNGLQNLKPGEADTVIIAGMGGMLINEILDGGKSLYPHVKRWILQPMTAVEETRKYLVENGFAIEAERLAREDDKIYCVLSVVRGAMEISHRLDYYIGTKLVEARDPLLYDYISGKLYEYDKAIRSLEQSDTKQARERLAHFSGLSAEMYQLREECVAW